MTINWVLGDALTELRRLPDGSFAGVVTSPPYNLGHHHERARGKKRRWQGQYPGFADKLSAPEYVSYHRAVLEEIMRALRNDGLAWYVHRRRPDIAGRSEATLLDRVIDGFPVRSEIIWHKPGGGVFNLPHRGNGGPVCYPAVKYETVFLLAKTECASVDRGIAKLGDVWSIPRARVKGHPAAFPVALAERCIAATSARGPVLDPFVGTGSTALAALRQGRDCTGIELVAETLELAPAPSGEFPTPGFAAVNSAKGGYSAHALGAPKEGENMDMPDLTYLSLGWGVQSFTLAAMVALEEVPPIVLAIHADTPHEKERSR